MTSDSTPAANYCATRVTQVARQRRHPEKHRDEKKGNNTQDTEQEDRAGSAWNFRETLQRGVAELRRPACHGLHARIRSRHWRKRSRDDNGESAYLHLESAMHASPLRTMRQIQ
jgi:hypothetical protein